MLSASVAFGPMVVVTHWKKTTTAGVPSLMCVPLENVGPKPFAKAMLERGMICIIRLTCLPQAPK